MASNQSGKNLAKMKDPVEFIQVWRDQLIDLTKRNTLLNFKAPKTSSITISHPTAIETVSLLLEGEPVRLTHLRILVELELEPDVEPAETSGERRQSWQKLETLLPGILYADLLESDLRTRAGTIERRTTQEFLDRGLWTLYVAFGQLVWRDIDGESFRAPLLLIPVSVTASSERTIWTLNRTDEDVVLNPALQIKAERLGVVIPQAATEQDDFDPAQWIRTVNAAVEEAAGWNAEESAVLSRFSFFKEAMYRDLLDNEEAIAAHDVIRAIIDPESAALGESEFVDPTSVDQVLPPETTPLIRDADSSQCAAIATALHGSSLVIDGPPGTGKSQTIANLIGAFLHKKQTVLFVSEKAAALEVVRDRLKEAGLVDYVLELHSHKATRKEVAAALGDALSSKPKPPRPMSEAELGRVESLREELAAAAEAANMIREPLGRSFNEVVGIVAGMADAPNAPGCSLTSETISLDLLSEVRRLGKRASHSWRPVSELNRFPWRGARGQMTYETKISKGQLTLNDLEIAVDPFAGWINSFDWKLSDLPDLLETVRSCEVEADLIVEVWLMAPSLTPTLQAIAALRRILDVHRTSTEKLNAIIEGNSPETELVELPDFVRMPIGKDAWQELQIDDIEEAMRAASLLAKLASRFEKAAAATDRLLDLDSKTDLEGAERRQQLLKIATSDLKPPVEWLKTNALEQVGGAAARLKAAWDEEIEVRQRAEKYWTEEILAQDIQGLRVRFVNIYRGLKRFSSDCRADKEILARSGQPGQKAKGLQKVLDLAAEWQASIRQREMAENEFSPILASQYRGVNTQWSKLDQRVENGREVRHRLGNTLTSAQTRFLTGDDEPDPSIETELLYDIDAFVGAFEREWPHLPEYSAALRRRNAPDLIGDLQVLIKLLGQCATALVELTPLLKLDIMPTLGSLRDISEHRGICNAMERELNSSHEELGRELGAFYEGLNSSLVAIDRSFELTKRLRDIASGALSPSQVRVIKSADIGGAEAVIEATGRYAESVNQIVGLFDDETEQEVRGEFDRFENARDFMSALLEDSTGQQEWTDFNEIINRCAELGLKATIDFCLQEAIDAEDVEKILVKSLLRTWADSVLAADPALAKVRSYDKDAIVAEYRTLDRGLISHAVSPIIESANLLRPQSNHGQSAVIKSESLKKRRHLPIRELLGKTQGAAQALKPVFMMSPLSVSQFLPTGMKFDVVIFDEASQVRPADAINCIYRGRSVIIAGDDRQLPPTNYWDSDSSDSETLEDDIDATDFESVLDIAKRAMPVRSLLWHYRSRHEDLITFSNRNFYDGKLFTFPSARQKSDDLGVAFFKVVGTYRRGTTRDNPEEARSVALRVEHHFDTRPNRTLGVVTFSEAQRETVEREIELLRVRRPDLAGYFSTDRLHGFFIKNLESVQGDERDVIIFSIGYGFDANGKMSNNFGPINKPKGWRRLNVAITRALYRVEVVSTISASDIGPSTTDEVRYFQQYLAYAEYGPSILDINFQGSDGETESPFEDSVLRVLEGWGYKVRPQVGTAGYRIDLGIEHPERPGIFVLGIECDGYAYHSSQVARDRDRLRQDVLEGLGWSLHRIWGTAWYRHQNEEKDRLKQAITQAMSREEAWVGLVSIESVRPVIEKVVDEIPVIPIWVETYKAVGRVTSLPKHIRASDTQALSYMRRLIEEVVAFEGPVHVSILELRLRDAWKIGRIGAAIREIWQKSLKTASVETREEFFYGLPDQQARVRVSGEQERSVNQVAIEELAQAMDQLVVDALAISAAELFTAIARIYGWTRTGSEIQSRLEEALKAALEWEWFKWADDMLVPVFSEKQ